MHLPLTACLFGLAGTTWAALPSEGLFLDELPRVLTASRIAQSPLEAPAPVTVIDRATIRASGMTEIYDLMRLVPGFQVADWPKGSPMVVNHGMGDAYPHFLQVLVDGRSVLDAAMGNVPWQDLPIRINDIERIEVVRGPDQASYGANAFQGVVNIITLQPGDDPGGGVTISRGENDFEDTYLHLGRRAGKMDWRVAASARKATNFEDRSVAYDLRQETIDRRTVNAQLAYRPDNTAEFHATLGWSQGEDSVGSSFFRNEPYHPRDNENTTLQLDWHRHYGTDSEITLRYTHATRANAERLLMRAGPLSSPVDYDIDSRRDALEFQQTHAFADTLKALWGAGLQRDEVKSAHYLYGQGSVSGDAWQVFGNLDWRLAPAWLLHLGAMAEDHFNTDTLFSPRAALNYALSPRHALRLSGGRGYLSPTMWQSKAHEAFVYQGDHLAVPGLGDLYGHVVDVGAWVAKPPDPQTMDFVELGYVSLYPELGLTVDTRVFQERHGGYVDFRSCVLAGSSLYGPLCPFPAPAGYVPLADLDKAFYSENTGDIRVRGIDLTLDWRHPLAGRLLFSHAITGIRAAADTNDDTEASAPHHSSSLLWSKSFPWDIDASLGYYRVGWMKWLGDGDQQPAYERVDARLAKRFGKPGGNNEVALTVQNLNGDHIEFRDQSTTRRRALVSLRLEW